VVLLWAVPIVAVTVGVGVVLSRLRALEDIGTELAVEVHRTRELRPRLTALRRELTRSEPLVHQVFGHWERQES
jgi:cytochrome c-type biogenesis protein CcmH/NrfF